MCRHRMRGVEHADRARRLDEQQLAHHQRGGAHHPRHARRVDQHQREHHVEHRGAEDAHQRDRQQDVGERHHRVDHAHQRRVEAAEEARDQAEQRAGQHRAQRGEQRDRQRDSVRRRRCARTGRGRARRCRASARPKATPGVALPRSRWGRARSAGRRAARPRPPGQQRSQRISTMRRRNSLRSDGSGHAHRLQTFTRGSTTV